MLVVVAVAAIGVGVVVVAVVAAVVTLLGTWGPPKAVLAAFWGILEPCWALLYYYDYDYDYD